MEDDARSMHTARTGRTARTALSASAKSALSRKTARTLATALSSRGVARAARQRGRRVGDDGDGEFDGADDDEDDDEDGDGLPEDLRRQLGLAVAASRPARRGGTVRIRETRAGDDPMGGDDDDPVDLLGRSFVSRISSTIWKRLICARALTIASSLVVTGIAFRTTHSLGAQGDQARRGSGHRRCVGWPGRSHRHRRRGGRRRQARGRDQRQATGS